MSLLSKLKQDQLEARKKAIKEPTPHKMRASLLTTLIGEASVVGKNDGNRESTDEEVLAVIKKFLKNIEEVIKSSDGVNTTALFEKQVLMQYLPTQLTEDELRKNVGEIIGKIGATSAKEMGLVMKELQAQFSGLFDGKQASQIVRELLG